MLAADALRRVLLDTPRDGSVLDVGCLGFKPVLSMRNVRPDLQHAGCDLTVPESLPIGYEFRAVDLESEQIPFDDDRFDVVICAHVLEHLRDPVRLFGELVRVCRPGGTIFVETPSDRSTWTSYPGRIDTYIMMSFWDDPTHVGRPWTPQGLFRLAVFHGTACKLARYDTSWKDKLLMVPRMIAGWASGDSQGFVRAWWSGLGWSCYAVVGKPAELRGATVFEYFSFEGRSARSALPRGRVAQ